MLETGICRGLMLIKEDFFPSRTSWFEYLTMALSMVEGSGPDFE